MSRALHSDTIWFTSASSGHSLADQLRPRRNDKWAVAKTIGSSAMSTTTGGGIDITVFASCTPGHVQEPARSKELKFVRQRAPSKLAGASCCSGSTASITPINVHAAATSWWFGIVLRVLHDLPAQQ